LKQAVNAKHTGMNTGNSAILPSALNWPVVVAVLISVRASSSVTAALFTGSMAL
jgi:hypothetical protein